MKTSFNSFYTPIKRNIDGVLLAEAKHNKEGLIYSIRAEYWPDYPAIPNKPLSILFVFGQQISRSFYGTTRKEIKAAVNDINDFRYDPHLFLNQ
jgi:hypothetical protein